MAKTKGLCDRRLQMAIIFYEFVISIAFNCILKRHYVLSFEKQVLNQ